MKRLSRLLAVFATLLVFPPAHAALWPVPTTVGGGFGVQIKEGDADQENLSRIHSLGFHFVRFAIGWGGVEESKGIYDWSRSDALIASIRAQKLKMVIPLLGGNPIYDGMVPAPLVNTDQVKERSRAPSSPESVQAYARFVSQMVLRYGTDDIVWEIWNEPDLARFWPPKASASDYAVLADVTCRMVRQVQPKAVLAGPSLGRIPDAKDGVTTAFIDTFLSSKAARCVDAISVHPYRHGYEVPEAAYYDYETLIGQAGLHKNYVPIINTEWGYTTTQVTPEQQAAYVLRTRLIDLIWGIPVSIWYEWRDSRFGADDPEGHFGLGTLEGADKPALQIIEDILPLLENAVLERQVFGQNPYDRLVLLRQPDGRLTLVGWSLRPQEEGQAVVSFSDGKTERSVELSDIPAILATREAFDVITIHDKE